MNKFFKKYLISLIVFLFFIFPLASFAQSATGGFKLVPDCTFSDCDFGDFMQLARNLLNFFIVIAIPLSIIAFSYGGFLYITSGGDPGKVKKAHSVFTSVVIGLFFVLGAWLVVRFVLNPSLVKPEFTGILEQSQTNNPPTN